jgi:RNA recognition motif-containing protein
MQGRKLYVGNLNYSATEEQLEELFSGYGEVKSVRIIEGRGFGFVEMSSPEEAENAKESLNEVLFQGRTLRIDEAHGPKRREHSGGGGGYNRGRRDSSRSDYNNSRGNSHGGRNSYHREY